MRRRTASNTARGPAPRAATMAEQVPEEVMDDRLQRLQAALNRDQAAFNAADAGA